MAMGLGDQGACQGDSLVLAPGKFIGVPVQGVGCLCLTVIHSFCLNKGPLKPKKIGKKNRRIEWLPKLLGIKKNATPLYKKNTLPQYPRIGQQRGHSGTVQLMVLVDEKGVAENIRIFESSGYTSLDAEAVKTVTSWLFEPGTVDNTPQGMWVKIPVKFELRKYVIQNRGPIVANISCKFHSIY